METAVAPKTEKKGKVTSANFKKDWTGKFGTMYDHNIEFANGDKGVYTSKKKDQDTFKVGEEVAYTIETVERNGYKNDVIKPVEKGGFGARGFAPKNYKADFISFAASYAKDLMVAGKLPDGMKFEATFNMIYGVMEKKLNEINGASANENGNAN